MVSLKNRKEMYLLSEREKEYIEKITKAIPKMTEFDKGYFLGKAEACVENNEESKEETNAHE